MTETNDILVLGATGTVGAEVRRLLLRQGASVVGATRDPIAAARRLGNDAPWALVDLERPETFAPALEGVDRVLLVARPGDEEADRVAAPLIEAMARAGVRHVVNLSAMGAERRAEFSLRKVEVMLESSGLAFTHLRPNFFHQIFASGSLHASIVRTGELRIPAGDAKLAFLDGRDVAAVAARALTEPAHDGRAYTLTGAEALDHHQIAAHLTAATGRAVRYVPIDESEARVSLARAGLPEPWIERLILFYRLVRAGAAATVTDDLRRLLGREPISFERYAREHAATFTAAPDLHVARA